MNAAQPTPAGAKRRLVAVVLDEESIGRSNPDVEHERQVAIYDLLEQNLFAPVGHDDGPFTLYLSINGNRLVFDIRLENNAPVVAHLFCLRLRASGVPFVWAAPTEKLEAFLEGHRRAYEWLDGVPAECVYDNPKTAVVKILAGPAREMTRRTMPQSTVPPPFT